VWGFACGAAFSGLLVLTTTSLVLKTYNFPGVSVTPPTLLACGDEGGIREVAELLKSKSLPDDKVIAYLPHMVYFYCGKVDLYLQSPLHIPVVVSTTGPNAVHRMTGSSLVSSVAEWKDVLAKNHRIWFVLPSKFTMATFDLFQEPEVYEDLEGHLSLLLEDENAWVYLWER
jgi:hypothetical protein